MALYIDDRELIAAHRAGDSEAFEELVREFRKPLIVHAQRKLQCDAAAEDAFQETLVRAYRALPKFEGDYRLGPWLHRIMANVCVDEANRRRRDGEKIEYLAAQPTTRRTAAGPEDELGLNVDDTQLNAALEDLSGTQKEALVLRFFDELDYDEVAQISGVSEQNARARVSRARAAVRLAMKGVAVLPVFLMGILKRGEKAAAAAGSGAVATTGGSTATAVVTHAAPAASVLPAFAEASTAVAQVAPIAVPMIAKAAVGIGLVAAVLTPTVDSAVHQAVGNLTSGAAGVVSAELLNDENVTRANSVIEFSDASEVVVLDAKAQVAASLDIPMVDEAALSDGIRLEAESLSVSSAGPGRYEVSGPLQLRINNEVIDLAATSDSRVAVANDTDSDGRRRVDGLFVLVSPDSGLIELRLAGFAAGDGSELRIAGLFRSVTEAIEFASDGSFNGTLFIESESSSGALALTLTP